MITGTGLTGNQKIPGSTQAHSIVR